MFREDEITGLPVKLTRQEKMTSQAHQNSPTNKGQSGGETNMRAPNTQIHKLQKTSGRSLRTDDKVGKSTDTNTREKPASSYSDNDDQSSTSSEDIAPSPKRQNQNVRHPQLQRYYNKNKQGTANRRCQLHSGIPYRLT